MGRDESWELGGKTIFGEAQCQKYSGPAIADVLIYCQFQIPSLLIFCKVAITQLKKSDLRRCLQKETGGRRSVFCFKKCTEIFRLLFELRMSDC